VNIQIAVYCKAFVKILAQMWFLLNVSAVVGKKSPLRNKTTSTKYALVKS